MMYKNDQRRIIDAKFVMDNLVADTQGRLSELGIDQHRCSTHGWRLMISSSSKVWITMSHRKIRQKSSSCWSRKPAGLARGRNASLITAFIEEHAVDEYTPDREGMVRDFGRFLVEQERIVRECVESGSFPANSGMSARGVSVLGEWFSFDDFFTSRITPRGDGVDSRA